MDPMGTTPTTGFSTNENLGIGVSKAVLPPTSHQDADHGAPRGDFVAPRIETEAEDEHIV